MEAAKAQAALHHSLAEVAATLKITIKEKQKEAIHAFLSGRDVFVSLPTGYGKSLIYAILPLVFDHIKGKRNLSSSLYYYYYCECNNNNNNF